MTVQSSLGTVLSVKLAAPAAYTAASFETHFTTDGLEVGEVADLGEYGGEREIVTHTPVKTGIVTKLPGPVDYGTMSTQMARVFGDVGQVALKSGFDGTNEGEQHSFKVAYADGGIEYFTGIITSFTSAVGGASAIRNASVSVALDNKVLVVEPD